MAYTCDSKSHAARLEGSSPSPGTNTYIIVVQKPKVIAIVGPTAAGKTSLSIALAKELKKLGFKPEIISADSRQVYKGLDIGTGKVTKKEMAGIPHHLIDVISPKKQLTVDDFTKRAHKVIGKLSSQKGGHPYEPVPLIVGGTGMYVDSLLGRMVFPNVPPNETLRAELEEKATEELFTMLKKLDPERAKNIDQKNKRRLVRAIEIAHALGASPKGGPQLQGEGHYDVLWLGVKTSDDTLRKNIHMRLFARIRQGMVAEAKKLHAQGLSYARMRELGLEYRFLADLLEKKMTRKEFEEGLERAIVQYAKRQLTWFKRNTDIRWVASSSDALQHAKQFLSASRH